VVLGRELLDRGLLGNRHGPQAGHAGRAGGHDEPRGRPGQSAIAALDRLGSAACSARRGTRGNRIRQAVLAQRGELDCDVEGAGGAIAKQGEHVFGKLRRRPDGRAPRLQDVLQAPGG
jgi:hypothetical protein